MNDEPPLPLAGHETALQGELFPACGLSPVRFEEPAFINPPFSEVLSNTIVTYKYTQLEVARLTGQRTRTVRRWAKGDTTPDKATRDFVIKLLTNTDTPTEQMRRHMCRMHNLTWDNDRMRWKLRLTLDMGRKIVGKRVLIHIKAANPDEAVLQRDAIIAGYEKLGLTVNVRMQTRSI